VKVFLAAILEKGPEIEGYRIGEPLTLEVGCRGQP
jgi:hypothetical protein